MFVKQENIVCALKWPSVIAKTEKIFVLRVKKFGRIDSSSAFFNRREKQKNLMEVSNEKKWQFYSVFQGFSKAKSANGGLILSSSQFLILPQLPQKMKLTSKVVKVDSKIIISLPKI